MREELFAAYAEIERIMTSAEWIAEHGDQINHGTLQGYQVCKKYYDEPCDTCTQYNRSYNKEYQSRTEVKERRYAYNRTNRKKTNKSRFEKYLSKGFDANTNYFTANTVLNKYGTDCYICNKAINLDAPRRSGSPGWELSLHIDHVKPLSKGGDDTLENVRPAHAQCNMRKGANEIFGV
jgi:5-methylcytosine-specific restriction endonuclease McrA